MRRLFSYVFSASILFVGVCAAMPAQAALTPAQTNAIVALLTSFGTDQSVITNVWASLTGTNTRATSVGSLSFASTDRPDGGAVVAGATHVPFTTFTLSNGTGASAVVSSMTVRQAGKGKTTNLESAELLDVQEKVVGAPAKFNGNQAELSGFTLVPGQSVTLTLAGNLSARARVGQSVQLEVVAINASVPVQGDLPLTGTSHTIKRSR